MTTDVMKSFASLQAELEQAKSNLKGVDEHIKKIMGRDPFEGQPRVGQKRTNPPAEDFRMRGADDFRGRGQEETRGRGRGFPLSRGRREPGARPEEDAAPAVKRKPGDTRTVFSRLSGPPKPRKDGDSAEEEEDEQLPNKPAISSRITFTPKELPSRQEVLAAQGTDEKSKARNRRMFGALLGTLQKFRQEETRMKEKEEKRAQVEKKLEENAKREKEELKRERQELFQERKRKQAEIRKIEFKMLRIKEQGEWEAKHRYLLNFIQTRTKPHIFYLPKVASTKTEERLATSQKAVTRMIEKKRMDLKEEMDALDKKGRWRQGLGEPEGRGDRREGNVNKENRLQSVGSVVRVADASAAGAGAGKEGGDARVTVKQEKVDGDRGKARDRDSDSDSICVTDTDSDSQEEEEVVIERVVAMKKEKGVGERTEEQAITQGDAIEANPVANKVASDPAGGADAVEVTQGEET